MPNQSNAGTKVYANYSYDALHRLTQIAYSDVTTPTVHYYYDQANGWGSPLSNYKGRLTTEYTSNASTGATITSNLFNYDPVGRPVVFEECTPTNCAGNAYYLTYAYDLLGNATQVLNGQGVTLTPAYSTAGRLTSLASNWVDTNHKSPLVSNIQYNALGEVTASLYGNGLNNTLSYYPRGWLYSNTHGAYQISAMYYYPNGLRSAENENVNGNWTYTYDDFNRLKTAVQSGGINYSYVYDRFGNRWQQNGGPGPIPNYTFDANNHISGSGVANDAAGNIVNDGLGHSYT